MTKIQKVSKFFRIVFQILFIISPFIVLTAWAYAPNDYHFGGHIFEFNAIPKSYKAHLLHPLSVNEKILGFIVEMGVVVSIYLMLFYSLIKLFSLFEKGEIFTLNIVKYIKKSGYLLFLTQLVNPIYEFLMGLVLTLHNPPGQRMAQITLSHYNLFILLIALMIILISWIMNEGYKLSDEQKFTI